MHNILHDMRKPKSINLTLGTSKLNVLLIFGASQV